MIQGSNSGAAITRLQTLKTKLRELTQLSITAYLQTDMTGRSFSYLEKPFFFHRSISSLDALFPAFVLLQALCTCWSGEEAVSSFMIDSLRVL